MAQILKLKDASAPWRTLIDTFRDKPQEGIVQDENDQVVAAVLPAKQYEAYQTYLRRREQNFTVLDRIAGKTKDLDPTYIWHIYRQDPNFSQPILVQQVSRFTHDQ